ncbi:MAG: hypothetical protein AAF385_13965, partial [Pseudomonadota bacterium]
ENNSGRFVSAADLSENSKLLNDKGEEIRIERVSSVLVDQKVYNIEVDVESVFCVGESGAIAHNAYFINFKEGESIAKLWRLSTKGRFSRGEGNVAVADIRLGSKTDRVIAHSSKRSMRGTVESPTNPKFKL